MCAFACVCVCVFVCACVRACMCVCVRNTDTALSGCDKPIVVTGQEPSSVVDSVVRLIDNQNGGDQLHQVSLTRLVHLCVCVSEGGGGACVSVCVCARTRARGSSE